MTAAARATHHRRLGFATISDGRSSAQFIAAFKSRAVWNRWSGSLANDRLITRSRGLATSNGAGSRSRIAATTLAGLEPSKARLPVSISYSTQPKLNRSLRASTSLPCNCSGDMYCNVPRICPCPVRARVTSVSWRGEVCLANPKSSSLIPCLSYENVGRLQIPMRDAFLMRRIQSVQNLSGVLNRFVERQRSFERSAFHQLHHQVVRPDIVQVAYVRVIQRRYGACLALEPFGELLLGNLDGDGAIQPSVTGLVHFAHATGANRRKNLVGTQTRAGSQRHMLSNDSTLARRAA